MYWAEIVLRFSKTYFHFESSEKVSRTLKSNLEFRSYHITRVTCLNCVSPQILLFAIFLSVHVVNSLRNRFISAQSPNPSRETGKPVWSVCIHSHVCKLLLLWFGGTRSVTRRMGGPPGSRNWWPSSVTHVQPVEDRNFNEMAINANEASHANMVCIDIMFLDAYCRR